MERELYREVEAQQDEAQNEAWKTYQKWALREIKAFEGEFRDVIKGAGQVSKETEKYAWWSPSRWTEKMKAWVKANFRDEHYKKIQDAMICRLLPVDLTLLDLPVLKLYHREFDKGWALLDGRDGRKEQDCVAESSAVTPKKSLRAVLNGLVDECKEQNCKNPS